MKCTHIVEYISAVTGNYRTSGYGNRKRAEHAAKQLIKEGAKNVKVFEYKPLKVE